MIRMRTVLTSLAAATLAVTLLPVTTAASSAGPRATGSASDPGALSEDRLLEVGLEYVALGDSWTANVVLINRDGPPDTPTRRSTALSPTSTTRSCSPRR